MRVVTGLHGQFIIPDDDWYVGRSLAELGEYSEGEVELYRAVLTPSHIVLEIGANLGAHTIPLAGLAKTVVAVEPQRAMFNALSGTLALNGTHNVDARRVVVGREPGTAMVPPLDTAKSQNFGSFSALGHDRGEPVEIVTLDSLPPAHFVKIDVEGNECDVIEGGYRYLREYRPALYVENDRPAHSARLIRLISEAGYDLWWHTPPLYRADNHNNAGDPWNDPIVSFNMLCLPKEVQANPGLRPVSPGESHIDLIRGGSSSPTPEAA